MNVLHIIDLFECIANYCTASQVVRLLKLNTLTYSFRHRITCHSPIDPSLSYDYKNDMMLERYECFKHFYCCEYDLAITPQSAIGIHMVLYENDWKRLNFDKFIHLKELHFSFHSSICFKNLKYIEIILPSQIEAFYCEYPACFILPANLQKLCTPNGCEIVNRDQVFDKMTYCETKCDVNCNYKRMFPNLQIMHMKKIENYELSFFEFPENLKTINVSGHAFLMKSKFPENLKCLTIEACSDEGEHMDTSLFSKFPLTLEHLELNLYIEEKYDLDLTYLKHLKTFCCSTMSTFDHIDTYCEFAHINDMKCHIMGDKYIFYKKCSLHQLCFTSDKIVIEELYIRDMNSIITFFKNVKYDRKSINVHKLLSSMCMFILSSSHTLHVLQSNHTIMNNKKTIIVPTSLSLNIDNHIIRKVKLFMC